MKQRISALLLALGLLVTCALAEGGSFYSDVPDDAWFAASVNSVTRQGLMSGGGEGTFDPYAPVTRAMVITVLWKLAGSPAVEELTSFTDIDPADETVWYVIPAAWAKSAEVAWGYEDGSFHGDQPISREQLGAFLYRYAKVSGQPVAQGSLGLFDDADQVSEWAEASVRHMVGMGLFRGNEERLLNPQGTASRAELASILDRMLTPAAG